MPEPIPIRQPDKPAFEKYGLGWRYTTTQGITLTVDYLKRRSEELHGVLSIASTIPPGHVHEASFNFSSGPARRTLAKELTEGFNAVDWRRTLEEFCVGVMRRANQGEPIMHIGRREIDTERVEWQIDRLIRAAAINWWYGARASVKSQTAAAMAICMHTDQPFLDRYVLPAKVCILDYEDRDNEWEHYIHILSKGMDVEQPEIAYRHCTIPLHRELNNLAKLLDGEGITFLIIDSFGHAAGPVPEHGSYEATALNFGTSVRELLGESAGALVVDHVSQAARMNPEAPADPLGSQYKMAVARAGYELRKEKEPGSAMAHIGIFDRKHEMNKPIGVLARWGSDSLTLEVEDFNTSGTEMADNALSVIERITFQLQRGSLSVKELADKLGINQGVVRATLARARNAGKVQRNPDEKWGLSASSIYGADATVT